MHSVLVSVKMSFLAAKKKCSEILGEVFNSVCVLVGIVSLLEEQCSIITRWSVSLGLSSCGDVQWFSFCLLYHNSYLACTLHSYLSIKLLSLSGPLHHVCLSSCFMASFTLYGLFLGNAAG
jgi:hypothetical protein